MEEPPFRPEFFARMDEELDEAFYTMPRKVVHIDEAAIAAIKQGLPEVLPSNGVVLDLLSSWRSHWPEGFPKQRLVGLGLNAEEMADNPDLDEYVVHNVNTTPQLPFEADTFDAVVLTVSIQYITQPIVIFQEVGRILRPGGPFVVIFSNRMFPTKAVAIWRMLDDQKHVDLVATYFDYAGSFVGIEAHNWSPSEYTDPVYVVLARKPST
jgi:SAM-dependent methyltransferase